MKQIILIFSLLFSHASFAGLKYDYAAMMMKDLEDINKMMMKKIKKSKRENSLKPLVEALILICSRPDDDGVLGKVWPRLHTELRTRKVFDKVVIASVDSALKGAKNDSLKVSKQATYFTALTNMVSLFAGYAKNDAASKKVLVMISKADISVSSRIQRERKMRVMRKTVSPSKIAKSALNQIFPPKKDDDD